MYPKQKLMTEKNNTETTPWASLVTRSLSDTMQTTFQAPADASSGDILAELSGSEISAPAKKEGVLGGFNPFNLAADLFKALLGCSDTAHEFVGAPAESAA